MKAIQSGNVFRIYDNSMKTFDQLPPQSYLVNFDDKTGFFLSLYSDIDIKEKIYGVHETKVNKVLNAFNLFNRSLGVILSGDKGIGKSLFSKMLAKKAMEQGFPLIIVNTYIPGIAEYLNSIEQEVIILFDEFDKVFKEDEKSEHLSPQAEMLTLFDGIAQGKKLFVVTCNDLRGLNGFLVNRPGRFHYHFRFEYPNAQDIKEYLTDKIPESACGNIDKIIEFSNKVKLNYDSLRAIAFELSCGLPFDDAIKDLNIINTEDEKYTVVVHLSNGTKLKRSNVSIDLFGDDSERSFEFTDPVEKIDLCFVSFTPVDNYYDNYTGKCIIEGRNVAFELEEDYLAPNHKNLIEKYKDVKVEYISFHHTKGKNIHYAV